MQKREMAAMSLIAACRIIFFAFVFAVVVILPLASGSREDVNCIRDVDPNEGALLIALPSRHTKVAFSVYAPHSLRRNTLFAAIRFSNRNGSRDVFSDDTRLEIAYYDDTTDEAGAGNDTVPGPLYIATSSQLYYRLGAAVFDILTLGSLSVSERTNRTTVVLPLPLCSDIDQLRAHSILLQLVLKASGTENNLQLRKLNDDESSLFFSVVLFMPLGLLSLFLTILIFPCIRQFIILTLTPKLDKQTMINAEFSLLSTVSLQSAFFILFWTLSVIEYYCLFSESVDGVRFQSKLFSPITNCVIFYYLAVTASNVGGMLFARCSLGRAHITCCTIMGQGLLSSCTTAAIFHSVFVILALFLEPVPVLTNLVVFLTVNILLFLAIFAIIEQFRRRKFQGNFILVVMMQMTLSSLYYSLVASFASISFDEETSNATVPYLCVVTVISLACILLSIAAIKMMDKKKKSADTKNDVENPPIKNKSSDGGGVKKSTELAVINPRPGAADLAALAREMGFIVLIPGAVQAWQRRGENEGKV